MSEAADRRWVRLPADLPLPQLLREAGWTVEVEPARRRAVELWDTGDRRLAAAGAELTLNTREGWRWRRDARGHPRVAAAEWNAPTTAGRDLVARWTRAYRRGRPLGPRASVLVHSRAVRVDADGEVATFIEEWLTARRPGQGTGPRLRRVQGVLPRRGAGHTADPGAAVRRRSLPAEPALAVLEPGRVRSPRLAVPASLDGPRALFTRSAVLSVMQWQHFDCELAAAPAGDNVRKLRVAVRRLRSDLQTFRPLLDAEWAAEQREHLAGLGTRIGELRDAEMLHDRVEGLAADLGPEDRDAATGLLDVAAAQLAARRDALLAFLEGDEYLVLIDAAVGIATATRWGDDPDVSPERMARKRWRRLRRHVESLAEAPAAAELHRARILAKRTRYAAEACVPLAGSAAELAAARLADVQTVLGEHHDATVTREWLAQRRDAPAGTAFVAGRLVAAETRRVEAAEAEWPRVWKAASAREVWRWLRR